MPNLFGSKDSSSPYSTEGKVSSKSGAAVFGRYTLAMKHCCDNFVHRGASLNATLPSMRMQPYHDPCQYTIPWHF